MESSAKLDNLTTWTVQRTANSRFPFRIVIERAGKTLLAVRAQSSWPGPGQQIFCLREANLDPDEPLETIETVTVLHYTQIARKLAIVLDRAVRKRCEFLRIEKKYQDREETYEQIFFRTESGIHAHRSRSRLELRPTSSQLTIAVDSSERYAWTFPDAAVTRRRLAVGDYALIEGGMTVAVIERKSFDGLLTDMGSIQSLHHQLADLARSERATVVVEAQYGDFLDARRLGGRWPAAFTSRAIAELAAMHATLPIIFAGNRKLANQYAIQFFASCSARLESPQLSLVSEPDPSYNAVPVEQEIREFALAWTGGSFATADIAARFPGVPTVRVLRVLGQLEGEGLLMRSGRRRGLRWERPTSS
ncbi:MAG: ERCC4 domain-containing protein [Gemmatimonadaceae bacterium]